MLKNSQLFFANLMKKPKIPVRAQPSELAYSIADVLNSIVLSNVKDSRFFFVKSNDFNRYSP